MRLVPVGDINDNTADRETQGEGFKLREGQAPDLSSDKGENEPAYLQNSKYLGEIILFAFVFDVVFVSVAARIR